MKSKYELSQAWALFINNLNPVWNMFGHFTFRNFPHPESADKTWRVLNNKINREVFGRNYFKKSKTLIWVRASELQKRGAIHYHAVFGNLPPDYKCKYVKDMWDSLGGICRIQKYKADRGAEYYMSKSSYAWKEGEIDISKNLPSNPLAFKA